MPRMRSLKRTATAVPDTNIKKRKSHKNDEVNNIDSKTGHNSEIELLPIINKESGDILTCGSGDVGQLGLGEDVMEKLRPDLIPNLTNVVQIYAGGMHSVCLRENGEVFTWGCNDEGALGRKGVEFLPGQVELPAPAVMISAGDSHSAALLQDGRVFSWGSFRDASGNMGLLHVSVIEQTPVEVLPNHFARIIASGADHLVILNKKGQIFTFGCGQQGQLGRLSCRETVRERRQGIATSLEPSIVLQPSHKVEYVNIWAGTYGTFALDKNNEIFVFGLNNYYQLGLSKPEAYYRPTKSATFKGKIWKKICSGLHHTLALDSNGVVYALGRKEYGRLGLGDNCDDAISLVPIPKLSNKKCVDIATGSSTSFAVTDNGEVYSWGMGTGGALGSGEEEDVYEPTLVRGKQLNGRSALQVSSGGQHTLILATPLKNNNTDKV